MDIFLQVPGTMAYDWIPLFALKGKCGGTTKVCFRESYLNLHLLFSFLSPVKSLTSKNYTPL